MAVQGETLECVYVGMSSGSVDYSGSDVSEFKCLYDSCRLPGHL